MSSRDKAKSICARAHFEKAQLETIIIILITAVDANGPSQDVSEAALGFAINGVKTWPNNQAAVHSVNLFFETTFVSCSQPCRELEMPHVYMVQQSSSNQ